MMGIRINLKNKISEYLESQVPIFLFKYHLILVSGKQFFKICRATLQRNIKSRWIVNVETDSFFFLLIQAPTESATNFTADSVMSDVDGATGNLSFSLLDLFPKQTRSSFNDFDLKTLLETSPGGKSVLLYYATYNGLDTKRKNRLTDIIIRHLFTHIVNK